MIRSFPPSFADCRRQPTRRRRAPQPTSRRDLNQWPSTPRPTNLEQTKTSHRGLSSSRIEREPILEAFQFSNKRDHMPLRKAQAPVGATQRLRAAVPRTRSERRTRPKAPTRGRRRRFLPTCDGAFGPRGSDQTHLPWLATAAIFASASGSRYVPPFFTGLSVFSSSS